MSDARRCAFTVVRRVFEQLAYADRALHAEARDLDPRERALATTIAYGTVQRKATLDHVIGALASRPLSRLDPPVLAALRIGVFQLLFLDGVAEHAAVNESVELVKQTGRGGAQLVNAVLRRATREGPALLAELSDEEPSGAAVLHSVPEWLAALWWAELGADKARALLRAMNAPPESALRVNTLVAAVPEVAAELPVPVVPADGLPEGLVLGGPFDAHGSEMFAAGAIMPQSRGSMLVARTLAPVAHERVLDLCAAPGGKTTHLAALSGDAGEVVAIERHAGRAAALERTCQRMHAASVRVVVGDAAELPDCLKRERLFDRVLVDPPCTGLGTLQSRPDIRWRVRRESIDELAAVQARILLAASAATRPGGTLVYSVCTISRAEGEGVVARLMEERGDFALEEQRQLLPHTDGTDGFFIARLGRRGRRAARRYPSRR